EIHTKRGEAFSPILSDNIKPVMPLGYQLPVEFYSPEYDTQDSINSPKPDLRTTIYWEPNALTDDKGNVKLDFYTADTSVTYSVVIEGISDDGRLIHYRGDSLIRVE
ncbi:MAG: TonB-dependent receptor, partial [Dysgonamonadaceae bacterium]|nr:TonB-dependent receptor [Dysgonamonadaceae bacterium]